MKRDIPDFHLVRPEHIGIHEDLLNWARVVSVHPHRQSGVSPMFRQYRHGYEEPRAGAGPNWLQGWRTESLVVSLPEKQRTVLQWAYVWYRIPVHKMRKELGVTEQGLLELLHSARTMLKNKAQG